MSHVPEEPLLLGHLMSLAFPTEVRVIRGVALMAMATCAEQVSAVASVFVWGRFRASRDISKLDKALVASTASLEAFARLATAVSVWLRTFRLMTRLRARGSKYFRSSLRFGERGICRGRSQPGSSLSSRASIAGVPSARGNGVVRARVSGDCSGDFDVTLSASEAAFINMRVSVEPDLSSELCSL